MPSHGPHQAHHDQHQNSESQANQRGLWVLEGLPLVRDLLECYSRHSGNLYLLLEAASLRAALNGEIGIITSLDSHQTHQHAQLLSAMVAAFAAAFVAMSLPTSSDPPPRGASPASFEVGVDAPADSSGADVQGESEGRFVGRPLPPRVETLALTIGSLVASSPPATNSRLKVSTILDGMPLTRHEQALLVLLRSSQLNGPWAEIFKPWLDCTGCTAAPVVHGWV